MPEAHRAIEENESFDLILVDYVMPGVDGLRAIEDVIERVRGTPVAILSGVASRSIVEDALKLGAAGFVPKTLHLKSMLAAIDFMIAGEVYAPFDFLLKIEKSRTRTTFPPMKRKCCRRSARARPTRKSRAISR